MASAKNFNTADSKQQILLVQNEKGKYGGYRQELLSRFLNELEFELYICTKCNGIMQNACQIGDDQILVCEVCVKKGEKSQPMGKSRNKIPKLSVKCPLESRGCEWEGDIENIDKHIDGCKEFIIECWNMCGVILKRSEMIDHCGEVCLNRTVMCIHCKEEMLYIELVECHFTVCSEFPLLCLNGCMKSIIQKEMDSHIENDCPNTIVNCPNGCSLKLIRRNLSIHCDNECQYRIVNCGYCTDPILYYGLEDHYQVCLEFPLVCPNECLRSLIRREVEPHIENECPNTLMKCMNECGAILKRAKLPIHYERECEDRQVKCKYCQTTMKCKELYHHFEICPEFPLKCPNECMETIVREEMSLHIEIICPNTIIFCANGCGSKFKRSELLIHCEKNCQHRKVNCMHCKVVMLYKGMANHVTTCPELPLLCPNECMETFLRKEMSSHIKKDCPNTLVQCMNECGLKMKRRVLSIHCEYECQHRIVSCDYCGATLRYKELENHYKLCLEFPLFCPNECLRRVVRKEIWEHVKTDCPNTIVACSFEKMGCEMRIKRCEVREHEEMFNSKHLDMTVSYYSEREKNFISQLQDKDGSISRLADQVEAMGVEMEKVKGEDETLTDTIFSLEMKLFDNQQENERLIDVIRFYENENKEASILTLESGAEPRVPAEIELSDLLSEVKRDEPKPKPEPKEKKKPIMQRELEILPEIRKGLKTGFLHKYTPGIVSSGWKRKLVTLEGETLHFYNTTQELSLPMNRFKGVSAHVDDETPKKPGIPPNSSVENGFVIRIAGGLHYFVADTTEEAKEWMELFGEISKKNSKAKSVKRKKASVKEKLRTTGTPTQVAPDFDSII